MNQIQMNNEHFQQLKNSHDQFILVSGLIKMHERSDKDAQATLAQEIQSILNRQNEIQIPPFKSVWESKRDVYRYNHDFSKFERVKVIQTTITQESNVVIELKTGASLNIKLLDFYKLFKEVTE
ncbi:hypothetical protein G7062_11400 [Erysipelothrix sp. HDW6C]|uniref:hypothetical protein n=1 Tax=Erysipelothrix sp. HDW6C TaxID=2714930 RepID=UPI0014091926|nr:hypothetical protein [Erysipelothrix sp. HDW6C]QIK70863.1 hypothetical protein G7062_11400 [Erysipelothrix sp. HDW6C]